MNVNISVKVILKLFCLEYRRLKHKKGKGKDWCKLLRLYSLFRSCLCSLYEVGVEHAVIMLDEMLGGIPKNTLMKMNVCALVTSTVFVTKPKPRLDV